MRKRPLIAPVAFLLTLILNGHAAAQQQQPKSEDVLKNLVLVEKTQTVPDKLKPGFESITARDAITMLTYISSDLMEGRETATRGYQLAAEYAESLFALWNLKPAGDRPLPVVRFSMAAITSDSVEKVSAEMMEKITRLVYVAAYTLADK